MLIETLKKAVLAGIGKFRQACDKDNTSNAITTTLANKLETYIKHAHTPEEVISVVYAAISSEVTWGWGKPIWQWGSAIKDAINRVDILNMGECWCTILIYGSPDSYQEETKNTSFIEYIGNDWYKQKHPSLCKKIRASLEDKNKSDPVPNLFADRELSQQPKYEDNSKDSKAEIDVPCQQILVAAIPEGHIIKSTAKAMENAILVMMDQKKVKDTDLRLSFAELRDARSINIAAGFIKRARTEGRAESKAEHQRLTGKLAAAEAANEELRKQLAQFSSANTTSIEQKKDSAGAASTSTSTSTSTKRIAQLMTLTGITTPQAGVTDKPTVNNASSENSNDIVPSSHSTAPVIS